MDAGKAHGINTIGLFDSGVGGLSVLRKLVLLSGLDCFRQLNFVYLGDTARCPYGNRQPAEIGLFAEQICDWLIANGAQAIVAACNTSTALAGDRIRQRVKVPVYDLIGPTARYLARTPGRAAVLATDSTVRSRAFSRAVLKVNSNKEILEIACPALVPLVERGMIAGDAVSDALWGYVKDLEAQNVETVVFGCTHYPFLRELLAGLLPPRMELVDPADQLLKELSGDARAFLGARQTEVLKAVKIYVTGSADAFAGTASSLLDAPLEPVGELSLDELSRYGAGVAGGDAVSPAVSTV